jgi:hypothetical protein
MAGRPLLHDASPVEPLDIVPVVVRDPKDTMFVAAAIGGRSDFLVT